MMALIWWRKRIKGALFIVILSIVSLLLPTWYRFHIVLSSCFTLQSKFYFPVVNKRKAYHCYCTVVPVFHPNIASYRWNIHHSSFRSLKTWTLHHISNFQFRIFVTHNAKFNAPYDRSSAALNSNHNPYSDTPLPVPTDTPPPPSGRAFVWLVTGNSYGQDAKPPLQRIYRK